MRGFERDGRRLFSSGGVGGGEVGGGVSIVVVVVEGDEEVVGFLFVWRGGKKWRLRRGRGVEGAVRRFPLSLFLSSQSESFDGSFVAVLDGELYSLLNVSVDESGSLRGEERNKRKKQG